MLRSRLLRFLVVSVAAVVVLLFTACGGSSPRPSKVVGPPPSQCTSANAATQCGKHGIAPPLLPRGTRVYGSGIDFAWSSPSVGFFRVHGYNFAAGYLSTATSKNLQPGAIAAYHAAGIATVVVWETSANRALAGYSAGASDAQAARGQAISRGQPADRPIYFAVDFDTTNAGCSYCPYFQGVASVLGVHRTGAYGGLTTMRTLFSRRLISYGWQAAAWSYGVWDPRASIQQYDYTNTSYDVDRAVAADYGQWPAASLPRVWLRVGDRGAKVWVFLHNLSVAGWFQRHGSYYSVRVGQIVKAFQRAHHLAPASGIAGQRTQAAAKHAAQYGRRHPHVRRPL